MAITPPQARRTIAPGGVKFHVANARRLRRRIRRQTRRESRPNLRNELAHPHIRWGQTGERRSELGDHGRVLQCAVVAAELRREPAIGQGSVIADLKALSKTRYVNSFQIAAIYLGLGDKDRAFEWLENAYRDRSDVLIYLNVDPRLDSIRPDPRFADLVRRVGIP